MYSSLCTADPTPHRCGHALACPPPEDALSAATRSSSLRRQVLSTPLRSRAPSAARWSCPFLPRPSSAIARRCRRSRSYVDPLAMKTVAPMSTIWGHVGSSVTPSSVKIQPENRLSSRILPQEPQLQKFQRRLAEPPALGAAQDDDDIPELVNLQEAAEEKIEPEAKKEPEMEDKKDCHNSLL